MSVPRLIVVMCLEGSPSVHLDAQSREDELALLAWLDSYDAERLASVVEDDLDRLRRRAA